MINLGYAELLRHVTDPAGREKITKILNGEDVAPDPKSTDPSEPLTIESLDIGALDALKQSTNALTLDN